jgi:hypothetical protein
MYHKIVLPQNIVKGKLSLSLHLSLFRWRRGFRRETSARAQSNAQPNGWGKRLFPAQLEEQSRRGADAFVETIDRRVLVRGFFSNTSGNGDALNKKSNSLDAWITIRLSIEAATPAVELAVYSPHRRSFIVFRHRDSSYSFPGTRLQMRGAAVVISHQRII